MATSPLSDLSKIMQPSTAYWTRIKASWSQTIQQAIPSINVRDNLTLSYENKIYSFEPYSDSTLSIKQLVNLTSIINPNNLIIENSFVYKNHAYLLVHSVNRPEEKQAVFANAINGSILFNITNVSSIDLYTENAVVYAYARQDTDTIVQVQVYVNTSSVGARKTFKGTIGDCGTYIRATLRLIVTSCPSYNNRTGLISIYLRDQDGKKLGALIQQIFGEAPMQAIGQGSTTFEKAFQLVETTSDTIHSLQIMSMLPLNQILIHNFIYKDPDNSYIGDPIKGVIRQHLSQAIFDISLYADYKQNDQGNLVTINSQVGMGSGGEFLIINDESNPKFIYFGQLCNFKSVYQDNTGKCKACSKGFYSPIIQGGNNYCQECKVLLLNQQFYPPSIYEKMEVLCGIFTPDDSENKKLILALSLSLTFSCILITICCIICRMKRKSAKTHSQNMRQARRIRHAILLATRDMDTPRVQLETEGLELVAPARRNAAVAPVQQQRQRGQGVGVIIRQITRQFIGNDPEVQVQPEAAPALTDSMKSQLKDFSKLMPEQKLNKAKGKKKQTADPCAICFEEFGLDEQVRITPCKHIFHSECIMEWIKWKLPKPDCPNCRQEFSN
ncbi:hypothetical protein FGO68_gene229 [Halteria grandinella]|uniref:RING-type domain-containing protein n=1 Tax=Halteria grandinella TaxID=5974 RepID=A0A8J8NTX1_HALGN|nr:hypothetical protein FGO68_gene229 [Halteria grandinella]